MPPFRMSQSRRTPSPSSTSSTREAGTAGESACPVRVSSSSRTTTPCPSSARTGPLNAVRESQLSPHGPTPAGTRLDADCNADSACSQTPPAATPASTIAQHRAATFLPRRLRRRRPRLRTTSSRPARTQRATPWRRQRRRAIAAWTPLELAPSRGANQQNSGVRRPRPMHGGPGEYHRTTAPPHHCTTASLHHRITASPHHCIARMFDFWGSCRTAPRDLWWPPDVWFD